MQFVTIVALFALALGVTAHRGRRPADVHQQKNECGGGQLACCVEHSDIHADSFLSSLLTEGLLTPIIGSQEQSCAKFSLIENLNILGMFLAFREGAELQQLLIVLPRFHHQEGR